MRMKLPQLMLAPLLVIIALPAIGSTPQTGEQTTTAQRVTRAADSFMEAFAEEQRKKGRAVTYSLDSVDERLSLARCPNPLQVAFSGDPERTTRATLLVSCEGDRPWRLFLNTEVEIRVEGWVSGQPIGRGQRLTRDMLEKRDVIINQRRRSGFQDPENMLGMEARRAINAGVPITPDMLVEPEAVERGDRVVISSSSEAFSITTRGEAVSSGRVGDQIPVINENSGRRVRGRITKPGHVSVTP